MTTDNLDIKLRAWNGHRMSEPFSPFDINMVHIKRKTNRLLRYTGLKDKNGKEIFEGDIVTGFGANGVVEFFDRLSWDSGGSQHPGFYCKEWFLYKDPGELSYHYGFDESEVIGNRFEHPHLLEKS